MAGTLPSCGGLGQPRRCARDAVFSVTRDAIRRVTRLPGCRRRLGRGRGQLSSARVASRVRLQSLTAICHVTQHTPLGWLPSGSMSVVRGRRAPAAYRGPLGGVYKPRVDPTRHSSQLTSFCNHEQGKKGPLPGTHQQHRSKGPPSLRGQHAIRCNLLAGCNRNQLTETIKHVAMLKSGIPTDFTKVYV